MYMQSGVGNLGTESFSDVHRVAAEMMGVPWDKVAVLAWGDTSQNLPWTCVSGGSQTTHAMTRAAHAAASDAIAKAKEIAAKTLGGSPESYQVANERVFGRRAQHDAGGSRRRRPSSWAASSTATSCPRTSTRSRPRPPQALAGQGLMGVARDTYPRDGAQLLVRRRVRRSRSGRRDRPVPRRRLHGRRRLGHHHPPARLLAGRCSAVRCSAWGTRWRRRRSTTSTTDCRSPRASTRTGRRRSWMSRAHDVGGREHPGSRRRRSAPAASANRRWRRAPAPCSTRCPMRSATTSIAARRSTSTDPDGARARAADAGSVDGAYLSETTGETPWQSFTT